jgi:hypothetical protein
MRLIERGCSLSEPVECALRRLCAFFAEHLANRTSLQVLHHDEWPTLVFANVEDRDCVRIGGQPSRRHRFTLEPRLHGWIRRVPVTEKLDRHCSPQHGVCRAIHLTHAACR